MKPMISKLSVPKGKVLIRFSGCNFKANMFSKVFTCFKIELANTHSFFHSIGSSLATHIHINGESNLLFSISAA